MDDEAQAIFNASYGMMENQLGTTAYQAHVEHARATTKTIEAQGAWLVAKRQAVNAVSGLFILSTPFALVAMFFGCWALIEKVLGG